MDGLYFYNAVFHEAYNMHMFQILCIRKREAVSYLHYVYFLDYVYQKEGNCIILALCLFSGLCVSKRRKLYHTYNMFMIQIVCIRKRRTVSCIQYDCDLDFVQQQEGNCIIPTVYYDLCLVHLIENTISYLQYIYCLFQALCFRQRETVSYLQYVMIYTLCI